MEEEVMIEPIPFEHMSTVLPFPTERLPEPLKGTVRYIAKAVQVDEAMAGSVALAVLSVCLQGKARVAFSQTWKEELNLYVAVIAQPGERKSAVFRMLTEPVNKFVAEANLLYCEDRQNAENKHRMLDVQLTKAIEKGDEQKMREIQSQINDIPEFHEMKLITTDSTPEALSMIMLSNGGKMGVLSPEGGIFDVLAGLYSNSTANINIILQGYDGEPVRIDRKSGSIVIPRPLLTFGVCAQPDVMNVLNSNRQFTGRGLTHRFLFCQPVSLVGSRKLSDDCPDNGIMSAYSRLICSLLNIEDDENREICLSVNATDMFKKYADTIESQMLPTGALSEHREFFSKLPGKTLRIAALLHFVTNMSSSCISAETMSSAIALATYFGRQYLHICYADSYNDAPQILLSKITAMCKRKNKEIISAREINRLTKSIPYDVKAEAIDTLVEKRYLFKMENEYSGKGRPRSEMYKLNPEVYKPI